jgi:hypothetical protein
MSIRDTERELLNEMINANDSLMAAIRKENVMLFAMMRDTSLTGDEGKVWLAGWTEHLRAHHPNGDRCQHGPAHQHRPFLKEAP